MAKKLALIIGAQRSGKTSFCESSAVSFARAGGCSVVYNSGMPTDYQNFLSVKVLTFTEVCRLHEKATGKNEGKNQDENVQFYEYKGKVYHLKNFCQMFAGKCVKIERIFSRDRSEAFFFHAVYRYFKNSFVVFDDCKTIFQRGLPPEMSGLVSRINHAGKDSEKSGALGVDIALVFHGFRAVNPSLFNYCTDIVQFRTTFGPVVPRDCQDIQEVVFSNFLALKECAPYSKCLYNTNSNSSQLVKT